MSHKLWQKLLNIVPSHINFKKNGVTNFLKLVRSLQILTLHNKYITLSFNLSNFFCSVTIKQLQVIISNHISKMLFIEKQFKTDLYNLLQNKKWQIIVSSLTDITNKRIAYPWEASVYIFMLHFEEVLFYLTTSSILMCTFGQDMFVICSVSRKVQKDKWICYPLLLIHYILYKIRLLNGV